MAVRRVRIYQGIHEHTNLVGFSASAVEAMDDERFIDFMTERDYDVREPEERPAGGVSWRYAEVSPPLLESHLQELGGLCLDIIDPYHDGIEVIDQRAMSLDSNRDRFDVMLTGTVIARC